MLSSQSADYSRSWLTHVNDDGVVNGLFDATRSFDVSLKMARSNKLQGTCVFLVLLLQLWTLQEFETRSFWARAFMLVVRACAWKRCSQQADFPRLFRRLSAVMKKDHVDSLECWSLMFWCLVPLSLPTKEPHQCQFASTWYVSAIFLKIETY